MSEVQPGSGSRPSGSHRATLKVLKGKKILHISSLLLFQNSFADIYQLCLCQIAQFVTDAEFAKSEVNLIDKAPGLLSLPFQHSRC